MSYHPDVARHKILADRRELLITEAKSKVLSSAELRELWDLEHELVELSETTNPGISIFILQMQERRFEPEIREVILLAEAMRLEPNQSLVLLRLQEIRKNLKASV